MKTYVHSWQYLAEFFLEWEMFHGEVVEKMKTHIVGSITFLSPGNGAVYGIMWKKTVQPDKPQMAV